MRRRREVRLNIHNIRWILVVLLPLTSTKPQVSNRVDLLLIYKVSRTVPHSWLAFGSIQQYTQQICMRIPLMLNDLVSKICKFEQRYVTPSAGTIYLLLPHYSH